MVVFLIELYINKGLILELEIVSGKFSFTQFIDYRRLPFRCRKCRRVNHLLKNCSADFTKNLFPISPEENFIVFESNSFSSE